MDTKRQHPAGTLLAVRSEQRASNSASNLGGMRRHSQLAKNIRSGLLHNPADHGTNGNLNNSIHFVINS